MNDQEYAIAALETVAALSNVPSSQVCLIVFPDFSGGIEVQGEKTVNWGAMWEGMRENLADYVRKA